MRARAMVDHLRERERTKSEKGGLGGGGGNERRNGGDKAHLGPFATTTPTTKQAEI